MSCYLQVVQCLLLYIVLLFRHMTCNDSAANLIVFIYYDKNCIIWPLVAHDRGYDRGEETYQQNKSIVSLY